MECVGLDSKHGPPLVDQSGHLLVSRSAHDLLNGSNLSIGHAPRLSEGVDRIPLSARMLVEENLLAREVGQQHVRHSVASSQAACHSLALCVARCAQRMRRHFGVMLAQLSVRDNMDDRDMGHAVLATGGTDELFEPPRTRVRANDKAEALEGHTVRDENPAQLGRDRRWQTPRRTQLRAKSEP